MTTRKQYYENSPDEPFQKISMGGDRYVSRYKMHTGADRKIKKETPYLVRTGNTVSKQPKMKMMLTVKADLEVMMLHQIGRK